MKITLSNYDVAHALRADSNANWSRNGAVAMALYMESLESDLGVEIDLDVVAIRCDFSEYSSAVDAASEYGWSAEPDEYDDANEAAALAWLQDRTSVISFDGGVIISQF